MAETENPERMPWETIEDLLFKVARDNYHLSSFTFILKKQKKPKPSLGFKVELKLSSLGQYKKSEPLCVRWTDGNRAKEERNLDLKGSW